MAFEAQAFKIKGLRQISPGFASEYNKWIIKETIALIPGIYVLSS